MDANQRSFTDYEDKELRRLFTEGRTAAQVAKALGRTRNSVIGRKFRLKIDVKPRVITYVAPVVTHKIPMYDSGCRWPFGDPGDLDFHFCGKPEHGERPYCLEHCKVAYVVRKK